METDPVTAAQVAEWRRRAMNNQMTTDELRQWVEYCRQGRVSASISSAKAKAKKAPPDVDAMMDELENLT